MITPKKASVTIAKIKKMLFAETPVTDKVDPVATTDYKLADGTTVAIDKLEVGGSVTANGVAVPDGTIVLEDGTSIVVAGGKIASLQAKEDAPLETPEQMKAALQKFADGATPDPQSMVLILRALFENVFGWEIRQAKEKAIRDQAIATYQNGFSAQVNIQREVIKELIELVENFSKTEVSTPLQEEKEWDKMTSIERHRASKGK